MVVLLNVQTVRYTVFTEVRNQAIVEWLPILLSDFGEIGKKEVDLGACYKNVDKVLVMVVLYLQSQNLLEIESNFRVH